MKPVPILAFGAAGPAAWPVPNPTMTGLSGILFESPGSLAYTYKDAV